MSRQALVYADWMPLQHPWLIGGLRADRVHGSETFSFSYDSTWLAGPHSISLDPDLLLFEGPQYLTSSERPNFGIFLDSSPDRWGRLLMNRREAVAARSEKREPRRLSEFDYLLGVDDRQRMGGLRFKSNTDGEFLADVSHLEIPPWKKLRELQAAAWMAQSDDPTQVSDDLQWLNLLIAPGSSIGGARPKAGVCDEQGQLWIAKFPGREDETDVGAWEMVVHQLAIEAGLRVPEARLEQFGGQSHHTFVVKRFDRMAVEGRMQRIHFASAMTLLGYRDGANFRDGASYLEIVELITRWGNDPEYQLQELWRRILFSICVSNTDDHLRNHGFLLSDRGWDLSPAYDLNPNPLGTGLSLNISENDNALEIGLAMEVAPYFRIDSNLAAKLGTQIVQAVSSWRNLAKQLGIPQDEIQRMQPAFSRASG